MAKKNQMKKTLNKIKKREEEKQREHLAYVPKKQVENLKERIESSDRGEDKRTGEEILDKRNAVEKALNLTPDQNFIFDAFEILDRPQKALFTGIKNAVEGENVLEGVVDGITGEQKTSGADVLGSLGMDKNHLGTKALGLVADIAIDPLSWVSFGGVSKALRNTKIDEFVMAVDDLKDAENALQAYKASNTVLDPKVLAELNTEITKKAAIKQVAINEYSQLRGDKTVSEWVFTGVKSGFKKGATVVDSFTTSTLSKLDKMKKSKLVDAGFVLEAEKMVGKLDTYKNFKDQIGTMFNINKTLPKELLSKSQELQGKAASARHQIGAEYRNFRKIMEDAVNSGTVKMSLEDLDKNILFYEEFMNYTAHRNQSLDALLQGNLIKNVGIDKADADYITGVLKSELGEDVFNNLVGENLFKATSQLEDGRYVFKADKKSVEDLVNWLNDPNNSTADSVKIALEADVFNVKPLYSADEITLAQKLDADEAFKALHTKAMEVQEKTLSIIDYELDTVLKNNKVAGYLKHKVTDDYKLFAESKKFEVLQKHLGQYADNDKFVFSYLSGDTSVLKQRKLPASVAEANALFQADIQKAMQIESLPKDIKEFLADQLGNKMFEDTFTSALEDYVIRVPETIEKSRILEEAMISSTLANDTFLKNFPKDMSKTPSGFKEISTDDLFAKLENSKAYMSTNSAIMDSVTKHLQERFKGESKLLMSENVHRMIGVIDSTTNKSNPILEVLNGFTNIFKKMKLSNIVGTQPRNAIGNFTNLTLSGMSSVDVARYQGKAMDIISKADTILAKQVAGGVVTAAEQQILDTYQDFVRKGFQRELGVKMLESTESYMLKHQAMQEAKLLGKATSKFKSPSAISTQMNAYMDDTFKLAAFMYASENPKIYLDLGLTSPADFARYGMFDPDALTPFERNTMRKIVPFYTFSKLNLQYHAKNIVNNTDKYRSLKRFLDSAWDNTVDDPETQVEDYKKEAMWIPMFQVGEDGKVYAVKANLPPADFFQTMANPLGDSLGKLSPLVKAPIELTMNRQMFMGQEIEQFKGQADYKMPEFSAKGAYMLRQTGFDVPVKAAYDVYKTATRPEEGASPLDHAVSAVFNPILDRGHTERAERRKAYQELDDLKDAVSLYQQKGHYIKTLREARNSKVTNQLNKLLADIRKRSGLK